MQGMTSPETGGDARIDTNQELANEQETREQIPDGLRALARALDSAEQNQQPNDKLETAVASSAMRWAAPFALIPALTGFAMGFGDMPSADAAQVQEHVASVMEFGNEAWAAVQPAIQEREEVSARHWNDIEALMLAADNAGVHEVQEMRNSIIKNGVVNAEIPARIIHAALYSSAEYVQQMVKDKALIDTDAAKLEQYIDALKELEGDVLPENLPAPAMLRDAANEGEGVAALIERGDALHQQLSEKSAALQERIEGTGSAVAQAAIPYLGRVILDSENSEGATSRSLVKPSDAAKFKDQEGMTAYAPEGFEQLASFVIGRVGTEAELKLVFSELQQTDLGSERADLLFDVFLYGADRKEAGMLVPHLVEQVFRGTEEEVKTPQLKIVDGVPTFVAVSPNSGLKKRLAPLEKINANLVEHTIENPFSSDPHEQRAFAKSMLYLARQHHPAALPAIGQWHTLRPDVGSRVTSEVDNIMLEALAEVSTQSDTGFELMLHAAATNPKLMEYMVEAPLATEDSPKTRAGLQFVEQLRAHPERAEQWLRDVADGDAAMLLAPATNRTQRDEQGVIKKDAREKALTMMSYLDTRGTFVDYFRDIVDNPFAGTRDSSDMRLAINGLAMQRDAESVPLLLAKSADPSLSDDLKELALAAALHIDTPDIIPEATRAAVGTPFSHANILRYAPEFNHETGERFAEGDTAGRIEQMVSSDPFHGKVVDRYAEWVERTEGQIKGAQDSGQFPDELTREDRLKAYLSFERQEMGRQGSLLSVLRTDPELNEKVAKPLVEYLKLHQDERRNIDMKQAGMVMDVLSRAGITEAQDLIIDMVKNPQHFASTDVSTGSSWMMQMHASDIMKLKVAAIQSLGGMVNLDGPDDKAAEVLHLLARKDSSSVFRDAALIGLDRLADRYDEALAVDGADTAAIAEARNAHGARVAGHLAHHAQGLDSTGQIRLRNLDRNFSFARVADRLGGTAELIAAANAEAKEHPEVFGVNSATETNISLRPDMIRSVMHAMISNGKTTEDIRALGLDQEAEELAVNLYKFVDNEVYWLGNEGEQRYTGEGTDIVVLDAGYVYPVPMVKGLGERVLYPEGLEGYDPVQRLAFESPHPTAVAATAHEKAPDATIHSYNAWDGLREIPFRPEGAQGEVIRALEHIVERQIRGEVDFDAINYSFSYSNFALQNTDFREQMLDLTSAYIELAENVGIKHSISAGNSRGDSPASARYGGLGEVNALGMRFNDANQYEQPDGVFIAGAQDAYAGARLSEFTSSGDPLVPDNNLRVISFDGTNVLLPWVDGKWVLTPINGTSFAAPNQEAMIALADEAFEKAGVNPSMREWRDLMNNSKIEMPHYEDYEGGSYFHVASFLKEINRIIAEHRQ